MLSYVKKHPLICFLTLHFLVWTLLPLLRYSLPMDSIEAVVWGQYCDFGTNKHPPLSGFLAYWFYALGGGRHIMIYALSQVCVLLGFVYIYKLACNFLSKEKAAFAVMLLEGVIYYGFSAPEYNVNVVSLALWPMTVYYFYKALQGGKNYDWIFTGLFAGLNLLNKYVSGVLLLAMLIYMLVDKSARRKFLTFGPYLTATVAIAVVAPHIYWLWQHDFFVISYFLGRGESAGFASFPLLRHIVYPLKFLAAQAVFGLGALLIYFIATRKAEKEAVAVSADDKLFLQILGLAPLLIMLAVSMLGGIKFKSMWGFPLWYMGGIMLFAFFPRYITENVKRRLFVGVYIIMLLMATALACVYTFNKSDKLHLNAPEYALTMENLWRQNADGKPFKYVAGDVWWTDNVALYAPSVPKPVIWGDIAKNPWFDEADFNASGALVLATGKEEYNGLKKVLDNLSEPQIIEVDCKNPVGKIKRKTIYYGFYNL